MKRYSLLVLITASLVLAGCTAADAPQPQPTVTHTVTATAVPAAGPDCTTTLTAAEYASLEADGFSLNPEIFVIDDLMQSVMDDGFGCYWTRGGGDVRVWFAQAEQDPDVWATQREELLASGWTETSEPVEGVIQAPNDPDANEIPAMVHRDGVTYYASYSRILGSVAALQR